MPTATEPRRGQESMTLTPDRVVLNTSPKQQATLTAAWLAPIELGAEPPDGAQSKQQRRASDKGFLEMSLDDYLALLDWFGRQLRSDKRGAIPVHLAPILNRLSVQVDFWLEGLRSFRSWFRTMAGRPETLLDHARSNGGSWFQGVGACRQ